MHLHQLLDQTSLIEYLDGSSNVEIVCHILAEAIASRLHVQASETTTHLTASLYQSNPAWPLAGQSGGS